MASVDDSITLGKEVGGEAMGLVHGLIAASMDASFKTIDTLYERERERRQALEVLIEDVLDRLDRAYMGSVREYEEAVAPLRFHHGNTAALAARHEENDHL